MKNCELCGGAAGMYCESDQASLCWDCDRKVHGANFLVAKHVRSLLCHACQRLTQWRASGQNIGPAVSVCESCVEVNSKDERRQQESEECEDDEDSCDYDDDEEEEPEEGDSDDEEDDEDGENQVVPWSGYTSPSPPVVSSDSSSAGEDEVIAGIGGGCCFGLKRMRETLALFCDDGIGCSSSHLGSGALAGGEAASRALKQRRLSELNQSERNEETESKSTAVISSLKRLQKQMITNNGDASATVLGICRFSRDQSH